MLGHPGGHRRPRPAGSRATLDGPPRRRPAHRRHPASTRVRALLAACFAMSAAHGALSTSSIPSTSTPTATAKPRSAPCGPSACSPKSGLSGHGPDFPALFPAGHFACLFAAAVVRFSSSAGASGRWLLAVFAQVPTGLTFGAYHAAAIAASGTAGFPWPGPGPRPGPLLQPERRRRPGGVFSVLGLGRHRRRLDLYLERRLCAGGGGWSSSGSASSPGA